MPKLKTTSAKAFINFYKKRNEIIIPLENSKLIDISRIETKRERLFKKFTRYTEKAVFAGNTIIIGTLLYRFSFLGLDELDQLDVVLFGIEAIFLPILLLRKKKFHGFFQLNDSDFIIKRRKRVVAYPLKELERVFKAFDTTTETYTLRLVFKDKSISEEKWLFENCKSSIIGDQLIEEINQRIQHYDD